MQIKLIISILFLATVTHAADWTEKISMKGDFRFRTEVITEEQATSTEDLETTRQRMRLRLGFNAKINDETTVISRLATGSTAVSGSTSTNQNFDDYAAKKSVVLDLAYFKWTPKDGLEVWGGKTAIPFYTVGASDLYFDSDVTPEGMAVKYKGGSENLEYMVNLGASWLDERTTSTTTASGSDVGLLGAQLAGRYKFDEWSALLGVAQYTYANIKGRSVTNAKGNSTVTVGADTNYVNDYEVLAYMLEAAGAIHETPVTFYAEMIENGEANTEEMGSIYGVKIGQLEQKKDWVLAVDMRELEADSTVGTLSESDVSGGGTDIKGTRVGFQYQAGDNFAIGATHMIGEIGISGASRDYTRSMIDFGFVF